MKKLLYFVVSVLSLAVIFAAGWASGVGTVTRGEEQPAAVRTKTDDDCPACPENDKLPEDEECPDDKCKDGNVHKHGFRMKIPFPPISRDDIIRLPKTGC